MCGRFNVNELADALMILFGIDVAGGAPPRYNIAPTQPVAAVRDNRDSHRREVTFFHWGLVPSWAKDPAIGSRMINARAETATEKPSFRSAMRYRRCLIPAHGYYEWSPRPGGKQPYNIRMADGSPFAFAGLWEHWQGAGGEEMESCTILTTSPNDDLAPIHHRMPVILPPEAFEEWLDTNQQKSTGASRLLRPYPNGALVAVPVSRHVNNPRHNDALCLEPVDPEGESAEDAD